METLSVISNIAIIIILILIVLEKTGITNAATELHKHNRLSKDTEVANNAKKELFERKYYKDVATDEIVDLLDKWIDVIYDTSNSFLLKPYKKCKTKEEEQRVIKNQMKQMMRNQILYCSSITIELFARYMQDLYQGRYSLDSSTSEKQKHLYIVALIISNIKYDYSGDFTDPMHILEIKINDIKGTKDMYEGFKKEYMQFHRN